MQKRLVAPVGDHEKVVKGNIGNRFQAHLKIIEAVDRREDLIDGGIGASCL